ncbi:MAG: c-type cytochrome domain-containing protein [Gemmataceae bacterium]
MPLRRDQKGPKGGLFVDSRDGLLKGGDSGKSIVPGKPTESLIINALHGDGVSTMPPKGKLSDAVIADFEKWVKMGAP